jgi:hypothetical protein
MWMFFGVFERQGMIFVFRIHIGEGQGRCWEDVLELSRTGAMLLPGAGELDKVVGELEKLSASPLQIDWRCARQEESVASSLVDVITSSPDEGSNSNMVLNCIDPREVAQLYGDLLTPEERSCELVS